MTLGDSNGKKPFSIPAAFLLSSLIFAAPAVVWFIRVEGNMNAKSVELNQRINAIHELNSMRDRHHESTDQKILELLKEVRSTQVRIRDTQTTIRSTQERILNKINGLEREVTGTHTHRPAQ